MNYQRIYEYRFAGVPTKTKTRAWDEISGFLFKLMGRPEKVLDPAAGMCEFINSVPAKEKWAVDLNDFVNKHADDGVKTVIGNIFDVPLPEGHFNAIFASNFLEHLSSPAEVSRLLERFARVLAPGGVVCIMGPNFKYCFKEYFDCSDHLLPLSHVSVEEHLYASGLELVASYPRFLSLPIFWPLLGKQFLVMARRPLAT